MIIPNVRAVERKQYTMDVLGARLSLTPDGKVASMIGANTAPPVFHDHDVHREYPKHK